MTTSPYDTLPTGKQALAPTSGESIEEKPNPITNPYGGYEEISLEEAARLATPVISQSQDSGSSPAANRNSGDPGSAKPAASQPASAPDNLPHQLALTPSLATSILPAMQAAQTLPAVLHLCQIPAIPAAQALPAVLHLCQPNPC